jgi:hypothetical protein
LRERQRQLALATAGQKHLRTRIQTKKLNNINYKNSNQKHNEALKELQKRKSEQNSKARNRMYVLNESKGAAAGRKYKNQHMEEFHKMKKQFRDKKGMCIL